MITTNFKIGIGIGFAVLWSAALFFLPASQVILGLCGVVLLVAVLFFWNSLRTLGGDTDIPDTVRVVEHGPLEAMIARKKMLLLSLKDLDNERKLGKILPADFDDVSYRYREEVKALMREIDAAAEPYRGRAEELAKKHLLEQGLMPADDQKADTAPATKSSPKGSSKSSSKSESAKASANDARESAKDVSTEAIPELADLLDDEEPIDSKAITKPNKTPLAIEATKLSSTRDLTENTPDAKPAPKPAEPLISTKKSLDIDPASLEISRRTCPSCKASNEPDAKFCKECATPLRAKGDSSVPAVPAAKPVEAEAAAPSPAPSPKPADVTEKPEGATDA